MIQFLVALALADLAKHIVRGRLSHVSHASAILQNIANINRAFSELAGKEQAFFRVDISILPTLFTACNDEKDFLIKLKCVKKLLKVNVEALSATSSRAIRESSAGLAEAFLGQHSQADYSGIVSDLRLLLKLSEAEGWLSAREMLEGLNIEWRGGEFNSLWESVLKKAAQITEALSQALSSDKTYSLKNPNNRIPDKA